MSQGEQRAVTALPIQNEEGNVLLQKPEQEELGDVGLAAAGDREDANVLDEVLPPQVERVARFVAIMNGAQVELAGGSFC